MLVHVQCKKLEYGIRESIPDVGADLSLVRRLVDERITGATELVPDVADHDVVVRELGVHILDNLLGEELAALKCTISLCQKRRKVQEQNLP